MLENNMSRDELIEFLEVWLKNNYKGKKLLHFVESCMYESALVFTRGNQVYAAKIMGVARGTLRSKLIDYFGTTKVGSPWAPKPILQIKQVHNDV